MRGSSGDPLVLVHGSWADHRTWNLVAPRLAESFTVLTYDRRGHGRSPSPGAGYRIADDVDDLESLLVALDLYPAHLVGLSLGGSIALRAAARRSDLVRGLFVHEPPLYSLLPPDDSEVGQIRAAADAVARCLERGDRAAAAQQFLETLAGRAGDWARIGAAGQALLEAEAPSWLAELRGEGTFELPPGTGAEIYAPTLLTSGGASPPVYSRIQDHLALELANAVRRPVPAWGHLPHLTDPAGFVGQVLGFLAERNVPTS